MKKPKLIDDARSIWHRLWSVRLALISAALSAVEFALPHFAPSERSGAFAATAGVVSLAAAVARLVAQPKVWR
ncbi:MAG: hypothetical protein EKK53_21635 [Burkholderiales bacterium]|nr:MAG: hypothetical protein EKK53_21635 [Burkholderiales bacterium]